MSAVAEKPFDSKKGINNVAARGASTFEMDPRDIVVDHSFNTRRLDLTIPKQREELDALKAGIRVFGQLQPVVVRYAGQTVYLVFGYRRTVAITELVEEGFYKDPSRAITVIVEKANDESRRKALDLSSNIAQVPLNPVEVGEGFQSLLGMKLTVEKLVEMFPAYKEQGIRALLKLADSPIAVKDMVRSGAVSQALAIQSVEKHGDGAVADLRQRAAEAKAAGKTTATRTKSPTPAKPRATSGRPNAAAAGADEALSKIASIAMRIFDGITISDESDDIRIPKSDMYDLGRALVGDKNERVRALAPAS